jgi:ABC-type branched-subunit amino acid transport system substrate-binding protein
MLPHAGTSQGLSRRRFAGLVAASGLLSACTGGFSPADLFSASPQGAGTPQGGSEIGAGRIKVALILPLSAGGNAGLAAASMRNAAEMALAEFNSQDLQLLVKDDGGSVPGAQQAAQQAFTEGVELILGPLFAYSVAPVGQLARARNVPVIAFSTDANVAARGVYLLSFLPESDVERIVGYAVSQGKRSFAAAIPDNAYGTVVEAAFKQSLARHGGRLVALERYPLDRALLAAAVRTVAQGAERADAIFVPDGGDSIATVVQGLAANAAGSKHAQLLGTGIWEDPQIFTNAALDGAWYAGADSAGFRNFSTRYRSRFNQDPARTASLAYDAVALAAALAKTQGQHRFTEAVLTNSSGFTGIDGLFRFRSDGTNQRGLAVMRVTPSGAQIISPPPKSFGTGSGI